MGFHLISLSVIVLICYVGHKNLPIPTSADKAGILTFHISTLLSSAGQVSRALAGGFRRLVRGILCMAR